jgi:hypothetical protein
MAAYPLLTCRLVPSAFVACHDTFSAIDREYLLRITLEQVRSIIFSIWHSFNLLEFKLVLSQRPDNGFISVLDETIRWIEDASR